MEQILNLMRYSTRYFKINIIGEQNENWFDIVVDTVRVQ